MFKNNFIALRRPGAIPGHELPPKAKTKNGYLYFCHNLPRRYESVGEAVARIVKEQAGVKVRNYRVIDIESEVYEADKDDHWAITAYFLAELSSLPKLGDYGNRISEIIEFNKTNIPDDFGWWSQKELKEFLKMIK